MEGAGEVTEHSYNHDFTEGKLIHTADFCREQDFADAPESAPAINFSSFVVHYERIASILKARHLHFVKNPSRVGGPAPSIHHLLLHGKNSDHR